MKRITRAIVAEKQQNGMYVVLYIMYEQEERELYLREINKRIMVTSEEEFKKLQEIKSVKLIQPMYLYEGIRYFYFSKYLSSKHKD